MPLRYRAVLFDLDGTEHGHDDLAESQRAFETTDALFAGDMPIQELRASGPDLVEVVSQ